MKNDVKLLRYAGGDISHAEAAWASTGGMTDEKRQRIPKLLMRLGTSVPRHTVPFEHSWLQFQIIADVATHIQFLKHRTFSINTESARYKEYEEDQFYSPSDWNEDSLGALDAMSYATSALYHRLITDLTPTLGRSRAKESARYALTYARKLTFIVSCNFHSFAHFQMLRNSEHAQLEIRELAAKMLQLVREETNNSFEGSLRAWSLI